MFPSEWLKLRAGVDFHATVVAPANIAWVKYWGKKGPQLPANPSLSMTLQESRTLTEIEATPASKLSVELWFEGARLEAFEEKTLKYFQALAQEIPVLGLHRYKITSQNTFPHSSGIASSASSYAALALGLAKLMAKLTHSAIDFTAAANLARLGSGSATRSLHGGYVLWGESTLVPGSSDLYGVEVTKHVHPSFLNARDCILVVSSKVKEVSSRLGHQQMNAHPFAQARFSSAQMNLAELWGAMKSGDWDKAGGIIELEALTLHALMLAARPGVILLEPNTLEIIRLVRLFRKASGVPLFFTIDAGPNIHLIYPESAHAKVESFVRHELIGFTENGSSVIWDQMGSGAQ